MLGEHFAPVHGLIQTARGMCTDELPHHEIDALLAEAVDRVKELEDQRDAAVIMRAALTPLSTTLNEAVESTRECDRFRAALQDIAEQDFRGNRPWSATRAHQALHPEAGR